MSAPLDTPLRCRVHRVEEDGHLPAKDDWPAKTILKLGLESDGHGKFWAKMFAAEKPDSTDYMTKWPVEGSDETFTLSASKRQGDDIPIAKRKGGGGGGNRGRSPADTKAIQRQHSQEMAIRWLSFLKCGDGAGGIRATVGEDELRRYIDWFEADIGGAK